MADWSRGTPRDLLVSILKRITTLRDRIRFGAVCVSWRSLVSEIGYPPQHPWLWLPRTQADLINETCNFYSLSDKIEYKIHTPGIGCRHCIDTSEGWLILCSKKDKMWLLNPLTRAEIELPSIPATFFKIKPQCCHSEYMRAVVSWNSDSSFTVVIIQNTTPMLAFTRAGDVSWTVLDKGHGSPIFGLEHHKGLFYIRVGSETEVLDLTGPSPKFTRVVWDWSYWDDPVIQCFQMVKSSGDLFYLGRCMILEDELLRTVRSRIFKLDPDVPRWTEVQTLGDCAVFLGGDLSMSIPAHDFPGLKGSCIYFVDDYLDKSAGMVPDLSVFDLEDRSIKIYRPLDSHLTCPIPISIVPNLS